MRYKIAFFISKCISAFIHVTVTYISDQQESFEIQRHGWVFSMAFKRLFCSVQMLLKAFKLRVSILMEQISPFIWVFSRALVEYSLI